MTRRRWKLAALSTAALAVIVTLAAFFPTAGPAAADPAERDRLQQEIQQLKPAARQLSRLFEAVAEYVKPSVVYISAVREVKVQVPRHPFLDDPFFRHFMPYQDRDGQPRSRTFRQSALGSGFIVDAEGHILTNNHVVQNATELKVKLADNRELPAKLVSADPAIDLAVIKITEKVKDLPVADLGDSDDLHIGEWVVAIGSPFGLQLTVSTGIVSARGRSGIGVAEYENLIQTDAAINPGNSGGPLVNLDGQVIGVNSYIASTAGGFQGIGFAIPINMVKRVMPDLIAGKKVERGYLGVVGQDMEDAFAEQFGFKGKGGVLVNEVLEDTPAEKAGIKAGDILVEWNGKPVKNWNHLRTEVGFTRPGEKVEVKLWRKDRHVTVQLETAPRDEAVADARGGWLRVQVRDLEPEYARRLRREDLKGVVVTGVEPDSPLARVITEGDVILSINRKPVHSVKDFRDTVAKTDPKKGALVEFLSARTGYPRFIFIRK
jgi:serine protease Do